MEMETVKISYTKKKETRKFSPTLSFQLVVTEMGYVLDKK